MKVFKKKSPFVQSIGLLVGATVWAQIINVACSPFLTRLFTPEDFGLFAMFTSIVSIIGVVATGRLELALVIPKTNGKARTLFKIALRILIAFVIITAGFAVVFNSFGDSIGVDNSLNHLLYYVPLTLGFTGLNTLLNYWLTRNTLFKKVSSGRVLQSTIGISSTLLIGYFVGGVIGLVVGQLIGGLCVSSIFFTIV